MHKIFLVTLFSLILFASDSFAKSCYSRAEAEAEQGIRIHSELMVIGLNCMHMANANGENLYTTHKKFTEKHKDLFARYEEIMMAYLGRNGDKTPEKTLHKIRTDFANKVSEDAAQMRPDIFCRTYAPRIEKASNMDQKMLRKWATMNFPHHPVQQPLCASQ